MFVLKLHAHIDRFEADPFVARICTRADIPLPIRSVEALLFENKTAEMAKGFRAYFERNGKGAAANGARIIGLPESLSYLQDGDVVHCTPRTGQLRVMYRRNSPFNSMLVTEQCNSNCVMCSQPPKDIDDSYLVDVILQAIPLMDSSTAKLGITGGEPTLLGDKFLRIVSACKKYLPTTSLHVLSNGRLFSYLSLGQAVEKIGHPSLMFGIPIYSDVSNLHDYVVQAEGAFDQTIRGIMNLRRCNQRIEVRVVLHSLTIERLPNLAEFLCRNLPFVDHIALMGLEMMGYVKMNLDAIWIDPFDYQEELCAAVNTLARARMNVSIYNHQLCVLDRSLWPFARQSISDWKNEFMEECEGCGVKEKCGGFFSSAKLRYSDHIRAIQAVEPEAASRTNAL